MSKNPDNLAFLVNYMCDKRKDLSLDLYAHLWIDKSLEPEFLQYEREINPLVSLELSLRRRYFLESVKGFSVFDKKATVLNLGAGFTNYPYILFDSSYQFCEVDLLSVIQTKQRGVADFRKEGALPSREVDFVAADLNDIDSIVEFAKYWRVRYGRQNSFVMMEGLLYYLSLSSIEELFTFLREIQGVKNRIVLDFWEPSAASHPVFLSWIDYAEKHYGLTPHAYTYLELGFFEQLTGYRVVESPDFVSLERRFAPNDCVQDQKRHFPMRFVLLERI